MFLLFPVQRRRAAQEEEEKMFGTMTGRDSRAALGSDGGQEAGFGNPPGSPRMRRDLLERGSFPPFSLAIASDNNNKIPMRILLLYIKNDYNDCLEPF